jgi:hypothetical protein
MTYKMLGVNDKNDNSACFHTAGFNLPPANGWKIVVWAHGTTGVADKCAPSRQMFRRK